MAAVRTRRIEGKPVAAANRPTHAGSTPVQPRTTLPELQREIAVALRAVEPSDPNARSKKLRIFAARVLRWQFGDAMLADPGFEQLIDDVFGTLAANEQIAEMLGALEGGEK
jgi:hypothetical protein